MTSLARRIAQLLSLLLLAALCHSASAHPMGNFSVNHYSKITVDGSHIRIRYIIDLAEIPTYQELQKAGISATAIDPNSTAVINYVSARGLVLTLDGRPTALRIASSDVIFPPGAGGLPTMKMGFVFEAASSLSSADRQLNIQYADNNYPGQSGWKEVVATSISGSLLRTSVPATDRSGELSNYPTDLLTSPPQVLAASLVVALAPPPATVAVQPAHLSHPSTAST